MASGRASERGDDQKPQQDPDREPDKNDPQVQTGQRVRERRIGAEQPSNDGDHGEQQRGGAEELAQVGAAVSESYTQKLWMRVKRKAAYLPG